MRRSARQITNMGLLAGLLLVGGLAGCTAGTKTVLPPTLDSKLEAGATAEDYVEASRFYGEKAEALNEKVSALEQRAAIYQARPYMDPKGLKRASLERLAGTYRQEAANMEQQYALYKAKAQSLLTQDGADQGEPSGT